MISKKNKKLAVDFRNDELMIVCASRLIDDGSVVFAGAGLPLLAAVLAQRTRAPNLHIVVEGGHLLWSALDLSRLTAGEVLGYGGFGRARSVGMRMSLGELLQGGYVNAGFLDGAQIDQYGNINSTVVGRYRKPNARLWGSGADNDIASLAGATFIVTRHEKGKFRKCDYITSPGHLSGGNSRVKAGLRGNGPRFVVTDLCVLDFHNRSKKARLVSLHPGVSKRDVLRNMAWRPVMPLRVAETLAPTVEELGVLRGLGLYSSLSSKTI